MDPSLKNCLLSLLDAPGKADRIAGIARTVRVQPDADVLDALRRLAADDDQDVALFAGMTLSKLAPAGAIFPSATASPLTRELLAKPTAADIPAILREFREYAGRIPSELRAAVVKILARNGAPDDVERLVAWLDETPDDQASPYLDALESLSPQTLLRVLPRFLASKLPPVRGRAVSILNRLDPEEALAHLSELLASDQREEQLAGLRIAFQFPYDGIALPILNLLGETADNEIFQASAMFLLSNPELEVAYAILEKKETLEERRGELFGKLLGQLLPVLVSIGKLDAGAATIDGLVRTYRQNRLHKFLCELEIQISLGDPAKLEAIEAWLAKNLSNPETAAFVEKLSANPATEEMYRRLTAVSAPEAATVTSTASVVSGPSAREVREEGPEAKITFMKALSGAVPSEIADWLREEAAAGSVSVQAAALRTIRLLTRARTFPLAPDDLRIAEKNLFHENSQVAFQAMALLESTDASRLKPYLPRLLNSSDPLIASRAVIKALKVHETEAIRALIGMLASDQPLVRARAVNGLMISPFRPVAETVFAALRIESNPDIAKGLLTVVLQNPSPENLRELDTLATPRNPAVAVLVAQYRSTLFKRLLSLNLISGDETLPAAAGPTATPAPTPVTTVTQVTRAVQPAPVAVAPALPAVHRPAAPEKPVSPKPYSVAGVSAAIRQREVARHKADLEKKAREAHPAILGFLPPDFPVAKAVGAAVAVCGLILFVMRSGPAGLGEIPSAANIVEGTSQTSNTLKMGVLCRLTGKVTTVESPRVITFKIDDRLLRLTFKTKPPTILGFEEADVEIVPQIRMKNGVILADCYRFKAR
ncbi:hypothetical protein KBA41_02215 [Candidatus Ozemobacteraceae bacterium]|nr:hypothetical protein [Candidatus Ozemobacteraceae bacterium]